MAIVIYPLIWPLTRITLQPLARGFWIARRPWLSQIPRNTHDLLTVLDALNYAKMAHAGPQSGCGRGIKGSWRGYGGAPMWVVQLSDIV